MNSFDDFSLEDTVEKVKADGRPTSAISQGRHREEILYAVESIEYDRACEEYLQLLSRARHARAIQTKTVALRLRLPLRFPGVPPALPGMRYFGELCLYRHLGLLRVGRPARDFPQERRVHGGLHAHRQKNSRRPGKPRLPLLLSVG